MAAKNYRELVAWQKAMDLAVSVYKATKSFPNTEIYGLTSQLRRAAVSIPSNIAEGQGRHTTKAVLRFLGIAYGSRNKTETRDADHQLSESHWHQDRIVVKLRYRVS